MGITGITISCSVEGNKENVNNDLAKNLKVLETNLSSPKNIQKSDVTWDFEKVKSEKNPFDYYGIEAFDAFDRIREKLITIEEKGDYEKDVKPVIEDEIALMTPYSTELNSDEQLLLDSYSKELRFSNVIEVSKAYEDLVSDTFQDPTDVKTFLTIVSINKFTNLNAQLKVTKKGRSFTARENCANGRMQDMFESWNPIQWTAFAVGFLEGSLYWCYASCWYDCW